MKAVVAAFNQEKALVGAFSVIVQLHWLIVYSTTAVCRAVERCGVVVAVWVEADVSSVVHCTRSRPLISLQRGETLPGVKMHIPHIFLMSFNEANHDWIESFILLSKLLNKSIFSCSIAASRRTWTRIKEKKCWSCSWSENNSRLALLPLRELRLEPMRSLGMNIFIQYICDNIVCTDCFIIYWRWPLRSFWSLYVLCTNKQIVLGNNQIITIPRNLDET